MAEYIEENPGLPDSVGWKSKGYRDVYWCWRLNEPVIIEYRQDEEYRMPFCTNCGTELSAEEHTFLCHILKPR